MRHLEYRSLLELPKLAHEIEIKGPAPTEICSGYMKRRLQWKPSQTPMTMATEFLEEIHSDLRVSLPLLGWKEYYYISFYDDVIGTYHVKTIWHKNQVFEIYLEFISKAKNQSGKIFKRYRINGRREFDNNALKIRCLK